MQPETAIHWREAEAGMHEAMRDACTAAIAAVLEVSDAIGPDFAISNALARLERERSEHERAAGRLRARVAEA